MKKTTNFSLPTYEANDMPNLLDGYNNAMGIIDTQMKQNDDNATEALADANNALAMAQANATKIQTNTTNIANEVKRAKAAETANTTLINNEVKRAKAAEAANTTLINNEVTRAKAAEDAIEQNISDTADKITDAYKKADAAIEKTIDNVSNILGNSIIENIYGSFYDANNNYSMQGALYHDNKFIFGGSQDSDTKQIFYVADPSTNSVTINKQDGVKNHVNQISWDAKNNRYIILPIASDNKILFYDVNLKYTGEKTGLALSGIDTKDNGVTWWGFRLVSNVLTINKYDSNFTQLKTFKINNAKMGTSQSARFYNGYLLCCDSNGFFIIDVENETCLGYYAHNTTLELESLCVDTENTLYTVYGANHGFIIKKVSNIGSNATFKTMRTLHIINNEKWLEDNTTTNPIHNPSLVSSFIYFHKPDNINVHSDFNFDNGTIYNGNVKILASKAGYKFSNVSFSHTNAFINNAVVSGSAIEGSTVTVVGSAGQFINNNSSNSNFYISAGNINAIAATNFMSNCTIRSFQGIKGMTAFTGSVASGNKITSNVTSMTMLYYQHNCNLYMACSKTSDGTDEEIVKLTLNTLHPSRSTGVGCSLSGEPIYCSLTEAGYVVVKFGDTAGYARSLFVGP